MKPQANLLAALLLASLCHPLKTVAIQTTRSAVSPSDGMANGESLLIGAGDLVHVTVFRIPEMDTKARVSDAGDITLPLVGRFHVGGLTPAAASLSAEEIYKAKGLLMEPQVSILIEEYATQSVSVLGEVQHPGTYPIATPRQVMDVLALAGGLGPAADRHITIQHRSQRRVPSSSQQESGSDEQDVFLPNNSSAALASEVTVYPGDIILVPKAGIVYVLGDVGRPGGYLMQDDSTLTVLQAVALAAGTNRTAAEGRVRLVRRTPTGVTELPVPLKDMQQGKVQDIALQHDDILWVPFSYGKNLVVSGTSIVGAAGSAAIYRF